MFCCPGGVQVYINHVLGLGGGGGGVVEWDILLSQGVNKSHPLVSKEEL